MYSTNIGTNLTQGSSSTNIGTNLTQGSSSTNIGTDSSQGSSSSTNNGANPQVEFSLQSGPNSPRYSGLYF